MKDQVVERATTAIAAGALSNPLWLPQLEKALSLGLSILGIIWLIVQIYYRIRSEK